MTWAAMGAQIAGGFIQAEGYEAMAEDEAALHEYNAALADQEAKQTRSNTAEAQRLKRIEMRKTLASNRSITAGSGMMMKGTPAAKQLDVIDNYAYDIARTGQEGEVQARRFENQGNIYRMMARSARRRGRIQSTSALLGGAGSAGSTLSGSQQYS